MYNYNLKCKGPSMATNIPLEMHAKKHKFLFISMCEKGNAMFLYRLLF